MNGDRVEVQALVNGDILSLGGWEMQFVAGDQEFSQVEALRLRSIPNWMADDERRRRGADRARCAEEPAAEALGVVDVGHVELSPRPFCQVAPKYPQKAILSPSQHEELTKYRRLGRVALTSHDDSMDLDHFMGVAFEKDATSPGMLIAIDGAQVAVG